MISEFTELEICNLFSYYCAPGESPKAISLGGSEPRRNIVVIQGRNGLGKTSFLNSLRLLFLDKERAKKLVAGRAVSRIGINYISDKNFLVGFTFGKASWQGILNRRALREAQARFFVRASWSEPEGIASAKRSWSPDGKACLEFWAPGSTSALDGEQAVQALAERLAPDMVHLYFFDGDELIELAEGLSSADGGQSIAQIAGITRLEALADVLQDLIQSLPRKARLDSKSSALTEKEREVEALRASIEDLARRIRDLGNSIDVSSEELRKIKEARNRQAMDGWMSDEDRTILLKNLEQSKKDLARERKYIKESLLPKLVLLMSPDLVDGGIERLEAAWASGNAVRKQDWSHLVTNLRGIPDQHPGPSPKLTEGQREYLRRKIGEVLRDFEDVFTGSNPSVNEINLSPGNLRQLQEQFSAAKGMSDSYFRFMKIVELQSDIREKEQTLRNSTSVTKELRDEFEKLIRQEERLEAEIRTQQELRDSLVSSQPTLSAKLARRREELDKLLLDVKDAQALHKQLHVARRLGAFVQDYLKLLRSNLSSSLSVQITREWNALMTSHRMIRQIELTEDLYLSLRTSEGSEFSPTAISAGMRHLLATAVIRALAMLNGGRAPVVIDTPLGRLDEEHQRQLAAEFYPNAARQVIILPTDSEINESKLHEWYGSDPDKIPVYKRFRLLNESGETTKVEMVTALVGGAR